MQGLVTFYPAVMDVPDKPASLISTSAAYLTERFYPEVSWTCPVTGFWSFVVRARGAPGNGAGYGGSGGAAKRTVYLTAGQVVTFVLGFGTTGFYPIADPAVVTFPDGAVMTAFGGSSYNGGSSSPGVNGNATGGDINVTAVTLGEAPAIDTLLTYPAGSRAPGTGGTLTTTDYGIAELIIYSVAT